MPGLAFQGPPPSPNKTFKTDANGEPDWRDMTASDTVDFPAAVRAQVEAMLAAGSNVTLTPSGTGAARTVTVAASGGGGGGMTNPMTTAGDLIVGGASGAPQRRGIGSDIGAHLGVSEAGTPEWLGDSWAIIPFDVLNSTASTAATQGTSASSELPSTAIGTTGSAGNSYRLVGGTAFPNGACRFWNGGLAINANRGGISRENVTYAEMRTRFCVPNLTDGTDTFTVLIGWGRIFTNAATAMTNFCGALIDSSGIRAINRASSVDTLGAGAGTVVANTTHVLRVVYDGTATRVFLDGTQVSNVSTGFPGTGNLTMVPTFQLLKTAGATNTRAFHFGTGMAAFKFTP